MNILMIVVIAVFFSAMLGIGFYASKKQKSAEDFFVAGRGFGILTSTATQIATGVGGGVMLAQVGIGYRYGFSVLVYSSIAIPIGMLILAKFFAAWLRRQTFYTTSDWMCHAYGESKALRAMTSFVVALYALAAWVAQPVAAGKILNVVTGLPVEVGIVAAAMVVIIYTLSGGIMAVAYTDVAQLVLIVLGIIVLLPIVVMEAGGLSAVFSTVPPENLSLNAAGNDTLLWWVLAILPATILKQTYHQRIFAATNERVAVRSLYGTAIFSACIGVWAAIMGMSIFTINPDIVDQEQALVWVLQNVLPTGLAVVVVGALVSAIVSSADSALHSASSCLTHDIYQMVFRPDASDKEVLRVSKIWIFVIGIGGMLIGIGAPNVLQALIMGYSVSAAGLFFPLLIGHCWDGATRSGAMAGIITGASSTLILTLIGTPFGLLPPVFWGLLLSLVATVAFSVIGDKSKVAAE